MGDSEIEKGLSLVFHKLSDENYEQSLAFYRLWFEIQRTYPKIPFDQISDDIWRCRGSGVPLGAPEHGELLHPTVHLVLRLARDMEADRILGPSCASLQSRLCSGTLQNFFENNVAGVGHKDKLDEKHRCRKDIYHSEVNETMRINHQSVVDSNLIAQWANSGYVAEAAIRNHILQSLVSFPKLYDHQADAIIILFKTAGATFEAYADPSVVDRCFELLKDHYHRDSGKGTLV